MEQSRPANQTMTYDEVSMEQSKIFVKALQVRIFFLSILVSDLIVVDTNVVVFSLIYGWHFLKIWILIGCLEH